ncbi:unnamed protein product, partial [Vitis vinifera]|uniref:Uncharacterized protein n=1 Tax=Vitis vinifera TaxID=29760 RepID=E0CS39_VITVI
MRLQKSMSLYLNWERNGILLWLPCTLHLNPCPCEIYITSPYEKEMMIPMENDPHI